MIELQDFWEHNKSGFKHKEHNKDTLQLFV
jgi:hypothetical protein